jgi:hypothetical protein
MPRAFTTFAAFVLILTANSFAWQAGAAAPPPDQPSTSAPAEPKAQSDDTANHQSPVPAAAAQPESPKPSGSVPSSGNKSSGSKRKPGASGKRRPRAAKAPEIPTDGGPRKVVVREGGAKEPAAQIVPGMAPDEARRERGEAEDLLNSTAETLKQLQGRTFDPPQQDTLLQIQTYMDEARSALKDNDISRAHTLAVKARLLAEELTRR